MTAAALHLMIVHLSVVGCPLALVLIAVAHVKKSDLLLLVAYGVVLGCALAGGIAYYSGPSAYEQLQTTLVADKAWVEQHAVIARAAFVGLVITAVIVIQALLQFAQDEPPARWLRWLVIVLLVGVCYLLAWSAHLGGEIRHPEIRDLDWPVFPQL